MLRNLRSLSILRKSDIPKSFYNTEETKWPERIFSGIQPTGSLHLGNYFGAILKWTEFQNTGSNVIYSIADLHSITLPQDPKKLENNIQQMVATLLACGIDPNKSTIFLQSAIPQHAELCWLLGCITTMARLSHLPQYKEKSAQLKDIPLGLFVYPVLQAADILLYKATTVPVGDDQKQQLQFAQHIAQTFNKKFGQVFPIPKAIIADESISKLRSLRNPEKKMSKSDPDPRNRIEITDSDDLVLEKCKKAVTDFTSKLTFDPVNRPGVSNLLTICSMFTGKTVDEICKENQGIDTGRFKILLAEIINENLRPIRKRIQEYLVEPQYLKKVLDSGYHSVSDIAALTIAEVKDKMGLKLPSQNQNFDKINSSKVQQSVMGNQSVRNIQSTSDR